MGVRVRDVAPTAGHEPAQQVLQVRPREQPLVSRVLQSVPADAPDYQCAHPIVSSASGAAFGGDAAAARLRAGWWAALGRRLEEFDLTLRVVG